MGLASGSNLGCLTYHIFAQLRGLTRCAVFRWCSIEYAHFCKSWSAFQSIVPSKIHQTDLGSGLGACLETCSPASVEEP